jgi:hypothetical protein
MLGISQLAEKLLASKEEVWSTESVIISSGTDTFGCILL